MNFKGRLLVVLLQIVNGVLLINMEIKILIQAFMTPDGLKRSYAFTVNTRHYVYYSEQEAMAFVKTLIEGKYGN